MKSTESLISAHHNYLVNNVLTPGFILGNPSSGDAFYLLADVVLPGESTPRFSARLFDDQGRFLVELDWNRIRGNSGRCSYQSLPGGFRIVCDSGDPLLSVRTESFPNGYLTHIQGKLFDENAKMRMETSFAGVRVYGEAQLTIQAPYQLK
ncbi:MAG: hypothetical protein HY788_01665 [Deltaproteobacteria bacterium]|nr:hypothetical protein [Deltaproteobacteria bacterium]